MISHVALASIWVLDQDVAKEFYVKTLGFVVETDMTEDGHRWLTIVHPAQPELRLALMRPGAPLDDEDAAAITRMLEKHSSGAVGLATDDCHAAWEQLVELGVEFVQPPTEQPYGVEAVFRDPCGNWLMLIEALDPSE
jgi:catechol 2,3-dioxygenase-like lactoylglutathione lyase family enzyme